MSSSERTPRLIQLWLWIWNTIVSACIAVGVPERGTASRGMTEESGPQATEYRLALAWLAATVARGALVLDLGCGESYGLWSLVANGYRGIGLEANPNPVRDAHRRHPQLELMVGSGQRIPFSTGTFDAIVAIQSLEHMPSPRSSLLEMGRVLREGAHLVLSTPLADHSAAFHSKYHTFEWTREELCALLLSCRFRVLESMALDLTASDGTVGPVPLTSRLANLAHHLTDLPAPLPPRETVLVLARWDGEGTVSGHNLTGSLDRKSRDQVSRVRSSGS
jgi:SAM-dependent methyltransferase